MGGLPTKQAVIASTSFPADARPMLAATADGLWKSGDGAKTWRRLPNAPPRVTALSIHPEKRDVIYVGTQAGELYVTEEGGSTWEKIR